MSSDHDELVRWAAEVAEALDDYFEGPPWDGPEPEERLRSLLGEFESIRSDLLVSRLVRVASGESVPPGIDRL